MKQISTDINYDTLEFSKINLHYDYSQYKPDKSVAYFYDGNWYVGIILECSDKNRDCNIKFIKLHTLNLHWLSDNRFSFVWDDV